MSEKSGGDLGYIQTVKDIPIETKNSGDLQKLQETEDLMTNQNIALQNKINKESDINGMFGWLVNLFNK